MKGQVPRPASQRYAAPIQSTEDIQGSSNHVERILPERRTTGPQSLSTALAQSSNAPGHPIETDENRRSTQLRRQIELQLGEAFEKCIIDCVLSDLISVDVGVTFDDIASLQDAKRILHEAIILPTIVPEFFTGIREPWKVSIHAARLYSPLVG